VYDFSSSQLARAMPGSKFHATKQAAGMAQQVNDTTYLKMRRALRAAAETDADPVAAAQKVIDWAVNSRARTIAEHQTQFATTDGQLTGWRHAIRDGAKEVQKQWVTAGDSLVRDSHIVMNGITVPIDKNFRVGIGSGPGPGRIGVAEEDINCRCVLNPVLLERSSNGHTKITEVEMRTLLGSLEHV